MSEPLYDKHFMAARYRISERTVVLKARTGIWPSTEPLPGRGYFFTEEMVRYIDSMGERWPEVKQQPAPRAQPIHQKQSRPRRSPVPTPVPTVQGSNVRRLVAKPRRTA